MSSIKSTQIDGDVSVSRNAAVGGDVTVQGKTHLKGNVKIEGWLEAKNIKAASKGLFTTIEKLKAAYPFPHDGWWAATGQTGGNPSIDSGKFNEAVEKLQEDITKLQDDVSDIEDKNSSQDTSLTTLGNSVNSLQEQVNTTKDTANKASAKANEVGNQLNDLKGTKGENGGIAPLNEYGKVPSRYLPASMDDVKDFDGFVEKVVVQPSSIGKSSTDDGCKIYYHKDTDSLVLFYDGVYYNNWLDSELFGNETIDGITPVSDKVYSSDLALGYTSSTAFPGDEGADLKQKMLQANEDITENKNVLLSHYKQIVARSVVNVNQLFGLTNRKIMCDIRIC